MEKKPSKGVILLTLLIIIILAMGTYFIFRPKTSLPPPALLDTTGYPTLGQPGASIHIVVFEDLKCGNCQRYSTTLFPQIQQKYINTGKATYTLIPIAFIPGSLPAANAAQCLLSQNKNYFFPFIEYVFQHQPPENVDWATVPTLIQFAKAAAPQANLNQLSDCIVEGRYNNVIENNFKLATKIMKDEVATPALYVNGYKVQDVSLSGIETIIAALPKH